jgi:formamidopyrimidine-DNA glycosylase
MPELPEVEVVRAGLEPAVSGSVITRVQVRDERSLKRHRGPAEDFVASLEGKKILGVARRGKFLWFPLENSPSALVAHLGMSGQILLGQQGDDFGSHTRIRCELSTATTPSLSMAFVDQRIFGSMAIEDCVPTPDFHPGGWGSQAPEIPRSVAHIARDPLDEAFDEQAFFVALRRKNTGIKRALLDQNLISGVGNIYADEALWATKLHYDTPSHALKPAVARTLLANIREVFSKALAEGGTSFDSQYVNVNGQSGYFSRSLQAYGREGEACSRCGGLIVRERFMNRSSYRCRSCQKVRPTR